MPTLTIRERAKTATGFEATLSIDNQTEYDITISDPFDAKQEQELEFYFEEWIKFPFDETVKTRRAAASIMPYGEGLFKQVFADPDGYSDYKDACRQGLSELTIEIQGNSPEFQALHWETLKDPKQPYPFAIEAILTRKRLRQGGTKIDFKPTTTINVLLVTARPDEESDVGYRTISRPLIEGIQQAQLPVNVEILRPGTFTALSDHLEKKEGYYHIVHFDTHGGLMNYQQYQAGKRLNRYTYQLADYDGTKAFLFLEGEQKGQSSPIDAQTVADLLTNKGIPICILNACQSAKQLQATDGKTVAVETSLGSQLISAGVQMVVAMGYSVTVSAAALMMEKLYSQLFAQKGVPEAIRLGRKALYQQKDRRVYFNQIVDLEDWLLPVVYANREVDLNLREMGLEEEEAYYQAITALEERYQFKDPVYGFVGRDLDILKIEKALFRHNVLLLRGMGGTGKTTLLRYLWRWWLTTGFVEDAFYFGYDDKAHTVAQIVHEIGKQVYDRGEQARFQAMSPDVQATKLAKTLCGQPYVLILDNLESVTGQPLAIQNTLPEVEQQKLCRFLTKLVGGKTRVVLGSRSGEEWLSAVFTKDKQPNVYALAGLAPESRSVLAEKVLAAQVKDPQKIEKLRTDDGFKRLMKLLAGYPLAMEVVLGNLARQTPEEVLAGLQAADVDLNVGGEERTNNILKCVEYSHSNLSPEAQKLLVCLAPFNSFFVQGAIGDYAKELKKLAPFQEYDFDQFDGVIQEAVNWGLLSPHESGFPECLTIQPIFPYFLRTKLRELDGATRDALEEGFKNHYQGLAGDCYQWMLSKEANQRQLGLFFCRLEYENLYRALKISLAKKESLSIFGCLDKYFELIQDFQSALKLALEVDQALLSYPDSWKTDVGAREYVVTLNLLGCCYLMTKQYSQANEFYQRELKTKELSGDRENQANTYHQLGFVAAELRDYEQARAHYQQALDIWIEYNDRYSQERTYHQLGIVAAELGEYEQARSHYQQALDIQIEYNDRYSQAREYHQLGIVLQELGDYEQARSHYQQALNIYVEYQDSYNQAGTNHQLGRLLEELQEYEQARSHLQQALGIWIEYQDYHSKSLTYHQLGKVSQSLGEYEQARSHYQQALDIFIECQDRYSQASTYGQLGLLAEAQEDYPQAQQYLQQSLKIFVEFNDQHSTAMTLNNLNRIYGVTQDEDLLSSVVEILDSTSDDVRELFAKLSDSE